MFALIAPLAGLLSPIMVMLSLTPTSAAMNFTQPIDSLPSDEYLVSLRLAAMDRQMCNHTDNDLIIDAESAWSIQFDDLLEFTLYNVTVTTINAAYRASKSTTFEFLTLSSCKLEYLFNRGMRELPHSKISFAVDRAAPLDSHTVILQCPVVHLKTSLTSLGPDTLSSPGALSSVPSAMVQ